ncbi:MAG: hypothetical protein IT422_13640 [Pirellulaceae bacterium]|nr:hypothetical protein [Pirellulaceae bacterium]
MNQIIWQRAGRRHFLQAASGLAAGALGIVRIGAEDLPEDNAVGMTRDNAARIQPWTENPRYWQYLGNPVMLLGGSKTDHLFLADHLKAHLDEMKSVGANYVRNTMSQREAPELKPYQLLPDGKFDLDQWNEDYWQRFASMLKWTAEREIIVQIEVWDRFDYSQQNWEGSPWNPRNNNNYTSEQSGLAQTYPQPAYDPGQPFFYTVPKIENYNGAKSELIRKYQEAFVDKMLSLSLPYGHVLYCINNETATPAAWGKYWIEFIQARAAAQNVFVCTTDMFDDAFEGANAKNTSLIFDDPQHYMFADISQVNSRNYDEQHWNQLLTLLQLVKKHPRPSNHTKIYGSGYYTFGSGGPEDGVERFWRDILGGSASARFHRPDWGNGLNDFAKASIQAARLLEDRIKFWDLAPHMELLSDRASNEAYVAAKPGESYAVYFTNGGSIGLDLTKASGTYDITWISVSMGRVVESSEKMGYRLMDKTLEGGGIVTLSAPYKGGWVAAIAKH